jgi:hypothetical protein
MSELGKIVVGNTPERLADLVKLYLSLGIRSRKVLECGPGVPEALAAVIPESTPPAEDHFYAQGADMGVLIGIAILPCDGMEPGQWCLREHAACEVLEDPPRVSHEKCRIIEEGTLG